MINIALKLLITATSLLAQLDTAPNLTPEYRQQVYDVTSNAIVYAQTVIDLETVTAQTAPTMRVALKQDIATTTSNTITADTTDTPTTTPKELTLYQIRRNNCGGLTCIIVTP